MRFKDPIFENFRDRCRSGMGGVSVMYISVTTSEIYDRIKKEDDDADGTVEGLEGEDGDESASLEAIEEKPHQDSIAWLPIL